MHPSISLPLIKEQLLNASPDKVWLALTQTAQLKQWCFDIPNFKPKEGHRFTFYGERDGTQFFHLCQVLEIVPQEKMKWLWSYDGVNGDTFVTFKIFPEGDKTKLVLTHEELQRLPQNEHFARQNFETGWAVILGELLPKHLACGQG